jgi:hypothetical protein
MGLPSAQIFLRSILPRGRSTSASFSDGMRDESEKTRTKQKQRGWLGHRSRRLEAIYEALPYIVRIRGEDGGAECCGSTSGDLD